MTFITNHPVIVSFQIGVAAAVNQFSFENLGPYLRENTMVWIKAGSGLNLPEPNKADTGIDKKYYQGIIMKLAGCAHDMLVYANGEYDVDQVFDSLLNWDTKKECSRNFYQYQQEYIQKVGDKLSNSRNKTHHFYNPEESDFLSTEKKVVSAVFEAVKDFVTPEDYSKLEIFSNNAQDYLKKMHSHQKADAVLFRISGRKDRFPSNKIEG